ncbi:unnamed protein product [Brachionus calyciflorus]|uniref:Uncharacterized protein n=1 Tax=Brachionus calyciflorus TaxID=104777 RepID=A0A814P0U5_9BILA|nr:unnamed protein product [Brachionus calyciflorus]
MDECPNRNDQKNFNFKKIKTNTRRSGETPQKTQTQYLKKSKSFTKTHSETSNEQPNDAAKTNTESKKTPQTISFKPTISPQDHRYLSIIITSRKLEMSFIVKINTALKILFNIFKMRMIKTKIAHLNCHSFSTMIPRSWTKTYFVIIDGKKTCIIFNKNVKTYNSSTTELIKHLAKHNIDGSTEINEIFI